MGSPQTGSIDFDIAAREAHVVGKEPRIAALEAENRQLTDRVVKLEEELALARLHRFAPRSEKHVDRLFNEAEQAADQRRREVVPHHDLHGFQCFVSISRSPLSGFAPALYSIIGLQPDDQRAAVFEETCRASVDLPYREYQWIGFDRSDLHDARNFPKPARWCCR